MSWNSGTFTLDGGDDRFEQEFLNNDDVNYQSMDAQFLDVANGINLCFPADGSKAAAGNWDMANFSLLNVGSIGGDVTFPDTVTVTGSVTIGTTLDVTGLSTLSGGATIVNGLNVFGVTTLDDNLVMNNTNITGANSITTTSITATTINSTPAPTSGTYTPVVDSSNADGTFTELEAVGAYTTNGNAVTCSIDVIFSVSGSPTGAVEITLPFTSNGLSSGSGSIGLFQGIETDKGLYCYIPAGSSVLRLERHDTGDDFTSTVQAEDLGSTFVLRATVTYIKV